MSIANEITNYANGLSDAYDAVNDMSGIIPQDKNMNNLDTAIRTIPQSTGPTYTAGNGIVIDQNDVISIDDTVVAELSDLPTKTSDLTNDGADGTSTYVENDELSTATVGKANQLTTARTIALGTGATGTATSFNGTANITIPVTDVKEAYVTWGNKERTNGDLSPETMGCIDEFGHNRLAYLPAACIKVAFSRDGGTTWLDYTTENGAEYTPTDADKTKFTTYAQPSAAFRAGGRTTNASADPADEMVRVRVTAWKDTSTSALYTNIKQLLVNMSTEGATGTKVQVRLRTIQNWIDDVDTWVDKGTYDISGWSGWNSLPTIFIFGGGNSQKSQWGEIELVFSQTGVDSSTKKNMTVISLRAIGSNIWKSPSEMASTGRLYTIDYSQNATFPGEVVANKIYPNADATYDLGASAKKWRNLYLSGAGKIYAGSNALALPSSAGTLALTSDIQDALIIREWS